MFVPSLGLDSTLVPEVLFTSWAQRERMLTPAHPGRNQPAAIQYIHVGPPDKHQATLFPLRVSGTPSTICWRRGTTARQNPTYACLPPPVFCPLMMLAWGLSGMRAARSSGSTCEYVPSKEVFLILGQSAVHSALHTRLSRHIQRLLAQKPGMHEVWKIIFEYPLAMPSILSLSLGGDASAHIFTGKVWMRLV